MSSNKKVPIPAKPSVRRRFKGQNLRPTASATLERAACRNFFPRSHRKSCPVPDCTGGALGSFSFANKYLAPRFVLVPLSPRLPNRVIAQSLSPVRLLIFFSFPQPWAWFVDPGRTRVVRAMASDRDTRVPAPMKTHGAIRLSRFHSPSCVRFFGPRVGLEALRPKASCERLDNAGSQSQPRLPRAHHRTLSSRPTQVGGKSRVAGEGRVLSRVTLG